MAKPLPFWAAVAIGGVIGLGGYFGGIVNIERLNDADVYDDAMADMRTCLQQAGEGQAQDQAWQARFNECMTAHKPDRLTLP